MLWSPAVPTVSVWPSLPHWPMPVSTIIVNDMFPEKLEEAKVVAKGMIARGRGKIINMCSMMSELGRSTVSAYAASKGGLKMLTLNMATEWARHNIQINGIGPGYIATSQTGE